MVVVMGTDGVWIYIVISVKYRWWWWVHLDFWRLGAESGE